MAHRRWAGPRSGPRLCWEGFLLVHWLIQFALCTFSISFALDVPLSNLHLPILLSFETFSIIAAFFSPSSSMRSTSRMLLILSDSENICILGTAARLICRR